MTRPWYTSGVGLFLAVGGMLTVARGDSESALVLKPGERIVFFGDSITQAGTAPGGYVTLVKAALAAKRPNLKVEVIGAGIGGNRVPDLESRVDADVLAKKPTLVVIYIGINDVWHHQLPNRKGTPKDKFEQGLSGLVRKINSAGARVALCTPSVIGERADGANQLDPMLDEYAEVSRRVARETQAQLIDLRKAFLAHLKTRNPDNKERDVLTSDGVHLNSEGNRFVAERVLDAFGVGAPAADAQGPEETPLRQVLLFKFKDEVSQEQVQEVVDVFRALPRKIDTIGAFEGGLIVPDKLAQGFTHCFTMTFKNNAALQAYREHAAHIEFVKLLVPRVEKILIVNAPR
ncbi:MAG: DUF459 domain-containing protein [Planctomycetaceae bacterium]